MQKHLKTILYADPQVNLSDLKAWLLVITLVRDNEYLPSLRIENNGANVEQFIV